MTTNDAGAKRRVIYMGTPAFAVPALQALAGSDLCDVALVVTQPDRPAGRGNKLVSPAVKAEADTLGLPVLQTGTLRDPDVRQQIVDIAPDLIVVAAFGMILGKWILDLPPRGCVNLHASLLPKYRGANPIASAIALGETETGVTLMQMDRGLDTGAVYAMEGIEIDGEDTTESLTPKLATLGGELLQQHLGALLSGALQAVPQGDGATLTRLMTKDDGWLDFSRPAEDLERHVRAMWSWPRAWTVAADGSRIQVHRAKVVNVAIPAGEIRWMDRRVVVGCGEDALELVRVQLPGGKPIEGNALLQSPMLTDGSFLGATGGLGARPPLVVKADSGS